MTTRLAPTEHLTCPCPRRGLRPPIPARSPPPRPRYLAVAAGAPLGRRQALVQTEDAHLGSSLGGKPAAPHEIHDHHVALQLRAEGFDLEGPGPRRPARTGPCRHPGALHDTRDLVTRLASPADTIFFVSRRDSAPRRERGRAGTPARPGFQLPAPCPHSPAARGQGCGQAAPGPPSRAIASRPCLPLRSPAARPLLGFQAHFSGSRRAHPERSIRLAPVRLPALRLSTPDPHGRLPGRRAKEPPVSEAAASSAGSSPPGRGDTSPAGHTKADLSREDKRPFT